MKRKKNLIENTKTKDGLIVNCQLDERKYMPGIKISEKFNSINIVGDEFPR
jgi:hypothetical protein